MDIAAIEPELRFTHGDPRPLAEWIERGGELTPAMRKMVASVLRGDIRPTQGDGASAGGKRTWGQVSHERRVLAMMRHLERLGLAGEGRGARKRARAIVCEIYGLKESTVIGYEKNARKDARQQKGEG